MILVKLTIVLKIGKKNNILKKWLAERNKTPFVICVPPKCDGKKVNTRYGMLQIGSPLSFLLNPVGFTTNIITNIRELSIPPFTTHKLPKLHLSFISEEMMFSQRTGFSLKMNELFLPPFKLPSRTRNCKAITV